VGSTPHTINQFNHFTTSRAWIWVGRFPHKGPNQLIYDQHYEIILRTRASEKPKLVNFNQTSWQLQSNFEDVTDLIKLLIAFCSVLTYEIKTTASCMCNMLASTSQILIIREWGVCVCWSSFPIYDGLSSIVWFIE
jgi:hypothetical protein